MEFINKHRRYSELVIGFLCFGLGQRLLGIGILKPWAVNRQLSLELGVVGFILFIVGTICFVRLLFWLLKYYNQGNQVLKVLSMAFLVSVVAGFIMGLLGQFLYDQMSISYPVVKNIIWILSSLIQVTIKIMVLYSLICFYRRKRLSFKEKEFQKLIGLALLIVGIVYSFSLFVPRLAEILLFVTDSFLILGSVYYFVIKEKN